MTYLSETLSRNSSVDRCSPSEGSHIVRAQGCVLLCATRARLGHARADSGKFALRANTGSPSWSLGRTSLDTTVTPADSRARALGRCTSTAVCAYFTTCTTGYSGGSLAATAGLRVPASWIHSGPHQHFPLVFVLRIIQPVRPLSRPGIRKQESLAVDTNRSCLK